jgi:hypothetical protein
VNVLAVMAAVPAVVAVAFAVSIGLTLCRFHRSAREGLYDAAAGASPLRGSR